MKHSTIGAALVCAAVVSFASAASANTYASNPMGLAYTSTSGVSSYAKPGGLVITGRCNRYSSAFASARANGAEVLAYLNPVEAYNYPLCSLDSAFYMGNVSTVAKWPYPSAGARANFPNNKLVDIRKGSTWSNHVVAYISNLMREDKVDGVFLDVVGARLWTSMANWDSWPQWEKDQWTDGNVDLVRRLDAARRAINPRFIVVSNGKWLGLGANERGQPGEQYVDGVGMEHHSLSNTWHRAYAARTFSNLGHRRVLAIGNNASEAQGWMNVQGITHASSQASYNQVTAPPVAFNRLTDRPKRFGNGASGGTFASPGLGNNYKRGSRFTLHEKGRLVNVGAYVDGRGGPSGSQALRVAVYTDSGGRPGNLVAQTGSVNISSGGAARWVYFGSSAALNAGTYWLMIHSGTNNAVARIYAKGDANWYGNTDTYSDGAANPAGSGSLGTDTISIFANYTVGH